ncbi:hypothetical protein RMSM_02221 [Rhodopirellula maiorica SM1]|uniref:Uncharacterized protein n=1 Tax=Rhodopirellula maiorica SM1 TaxID=1265738 RepID=M5RZN8_9BACT|nr:hypothetical protein RMSM_02221 [Rhodopirellula maiorica SM1]
MGLLNKTVQLLSQKKIFQIACIVFVAASVRVPIVSPLAAMGDEVSQPPQTKLSQSDSWFVDGVRRWTAYSSYDHSN